MIRILHIGMSDSLGGIETFIINLYRNIDKNKFQFDFIDFTENEICYKSEIEKMGGKIFKVTPRKKNFIKNKKELQKIIKENNYQIVHFHLNTLSYITPILVVQKLKNIKIIVHSHNEWKGKNFKTLLLDKINRKRLKKNNMIRLACSEIAGKWIFDNDNFKIINNGIDLEKFMFSLEKREKIRNELQIDNNCKVIGHIGAFRTQKNHTFIIDIFNEYLKENQNSMLLLVGEGELKQQIEEKVKNLKIERKVKFLGLRNDTDYLYSAFDYFLFPSLFEGLPISMIEAQASGINCIISDRITKEVILNDNVRIVSINGDIRQWINTFNLFNDFNRNNINNKLKKYDIENTVKTIEDIYMNT